MDEIREKFVEGYNNHKPQLLKKILVADVETPISSLLKNNFQLSLLSFFQKIHKYV